MCEVALRNTGRIYISLSRCIYQNLAFEEFLFRHHDLEKDGDALLMWSNRPAVVVGRHQNPWTEVNLPYVREQRIDLARRHSGGGTVYHDLGNLNLSLLTSHKTHCRPRNLQFVSKAINGNFKVNVVPNKRDDMELQPGARKCSGTAARISRGRAYHHLTLLVQADLNRLSRALKSPHKEYIVSNATASVRAPAVGFLKEDDPSVDVQSVRDTIAEQFASQFKECITTEVNVESEMVEHEDVYKNFELLRQWEWVFGKTPKFTFERDGKRQLVEAGVVKECTVGCVGDRFDM